MAKSKKSVHVVDTTTGEVLTDQQFQFQTHYRRIRGRKDYERNTEPSETVPNQALSVKEIMRRFASGLPLNVSNVREYDSDTNENLTFDDYMPDIKNMDPADRQEILENAKMQLEEVKTRLNAVASAKKIAATAKETEFRKMKERLEQLEGKTQGNTNEEKEQPSS